MDRTTTLNEIACQLSKLMGNLPDSKVDFASSLVKQQLSGKKKLSDKQVFWLNKLHEMAVTPPAPPPKLDFGVSLVPIISMFKEASSKLKHPAVHLEVAENPIKAYQSKGGKYPGTVQITDGGSYGNNRWYGRVNLDGTFTPGKDAEDLPLLEDFLRAFAANPAKVAAEFGHLSGRCCFCNSELTDERSTFVGYGPTCAKNWSLPYPKMSEVQQVAS